MLSTRELAFCALVAAAGCWTQPSFALDPRYPDWPCQQLKVPGIAVASVWNGPSIEGVDAKPADGKEADLVARLAARRTPMDDAKKLIADYLVGSDAEKQQKAKTLFAALYSTLNAQRDEVMSGIERFSRKQKLAAEDIRAQAQKLRDMQDKAGRRSGADRGTGEPAGVADPHFRGPAQIDVLCVRGAGPDRETVVRSRQRDRGRPGRRRREEVSI